MFEEPNMTSRRLGDFLTAFCSIDDDLDETTRLIRSAPHSELAKWLRPELDAAIRDRTVSASDATYLTSRRFDGDVAVARWLAELRDRWFG